MAAVRVWAAAVGKCKGVHIPFEASPRSTVGIEWELQLVDRDTRELSSQATEVLAELGRGHPDGEHPKAKHELFESCIEVITGVCETIAQAKADLAATVAQVAPAAATYGTQLACSGTHPFSRWEQQRTSPSERYRSLMERMQWTAQRLQIFGVHVHVGVRSVDKALPIVNALTGYVPHLLALSASSPFWGGRDTGLASTRSKIFEALPTAGLPPQLEQWSEFEEFMETLIRSETIQSVREVWWDIRPHPNFGTVEVRIFDGLPTLTEIGAVAAVTQCLVEQFDTQLDRGYVLPCPRPWVVRENKWRAARYGLAAQIVDDHGATRPVQDAILELVAELSPVADRLGCTAELRDVERIVRCGASYQRQRAVAAATGSLPATVDSLVHELRNGRPGRSRAVA